MKNKKDKDSFNIGDYYENRDNAPDSAIVLLVISLGSTIGFFLYIISSIIIPSINHLR